MSVTRLPAECTAPARADRRAWLGLAVLVLPCVVYAMDLTVLNLAVPAISADLEPTGTELLWIVDIYGFMVAGALLTMGAIGDRIGARRLLLIGAAAFAAASVLAAFSTSAPMLITARAVLGLAGAVIAPSTLSLIRVLFEDPRQRTTAIGIWVTGYSAGAAVGPLAGGALLEAFWWGSVLLLALPIMGLVLVVGPRVLPSVTPAAAGRLDLASAALSLTAVLIAVYGLKQLVVVGDVLVPLVWITVAAGISAAFVRRQLTLTDPMIDLRLFRRPRFAAALGINLVAFFVVFGMSLLLAQYLQSVLAFSPLKAGLWTVPPALGFVAGSNLLPRLLGRIAESVLMVGGLLAGAAGYAIVAAVQLGGLHAVVWGATLAAIGLGAVVTLTVDQAVAAAPACRAGVASATAETSSELGGALGIAILGAIGAAVFTGGLPQETRGGSRDTLAAVLELADNTLLLTVRDAFTDAVAVTATIGSASLLASAIIVMRFRQQPAPSGPAGDETPRRHAEKP